MIVMLNQYSLEKLWTAPEILRNPNGYRPNGTKAGDAYSFAIILHEMLFRKGAFYLADEPAPKGNINIVIHMNINDQLTFVFQTPYMFCF